jgi:ribonucleoside-diphosphate reductase alpha chain
MSKTNKEIFKDEFSEEIWSTTYKYHTDKTVDDTFRRVANAVASVEKTEELQKEWAEKFYDMLTDFKVTCGGRIYANAGTEYKGTTLINCYTGGRPKYDCDSLTGILQVLHEQSLTLKSEGGWGLNFSFIRPRGSMIKGIGVESPGAVKYMEIFDKSSEIITAGSGINLNKTSKKKNKIRKGAQMAILNIEHPDAEEFITAKQTAGKLSKFNMSINCSNTFMDKVLEATKLKESGDEEAAKKILWSFRYPDTNHTEYKTKWDGNIEKWEKSRLPVIIYKTVPVLDVWNLIIKSTYNRAEPGVLFLDRANEKYLYNYGDLEIQETNACSEQTMPPFSSCNLISINLTKFLENGKFDFEKLEKYSRVVLRFSDNVNDLTYAPLPEYVKTIKELRRVGVGIMGWGSLLYLAKTKFASNEAEDLKDKIMSTICYSIIDESASLAAEKGMFVGCDPEKQAEVNYFNGINLPDSIKNKIKKFGLRNSSLFSIQPTGNTSILANVVSGGCEPIFMHEYIRTSIIPDCPPELLPYCPKYWEGEFKEFGIFKLSKEGDEPILKGELNGVTYKIDKGRGLTKEVLCQDYAVRELKEKGEWDPSADWARTTTSISVDEHIVDMKGFTKWLDASCSKTINVPNEYPFEKFSQVYLDAYKTGTIKGMTTYRAGTMTAVLSAKEEKKEDKIEFVNKTTAPKRPKELPCKVEHLTSKGVKYYGIVGLMSGEPYEVFTGKNENKDGEIFISKTITEGKIIKLSRGKYLLVVDNKEYNLTNGHSDENADALTRMISTALRHGADISFVVHQLEKTKGDMTCFARSLSRALKKCVKDGTHVHGETCSNCGGNNIIRSEGCKKCGDCGHGQCN